MDFKLDLNTVLVMRIHTLYKGEGVQDGRHLMI